MPPGCQLTVGTCPHLNFGIFLWRSGLRPSPELCDSEHSQGCCTPRSAGILWCCTPSASSRRTRLLDGRAELCRGTCSLNPVLWVKTAPGLCCRKGLRSPFPAFGGVLSSVGFIWNLRSGGCIPMSVTENFGVKEKIPSHARLGQWMLPVGTRWQPSPAYFQQGHVWHILGGAGLCPALPGWTLSPQTWGACPPGPAVGQPYGRDEPCCRR